MMYSVYVSPDAQADIRSAFQWYESQRDGLGHEFIEEIDNQIQQVDSHCCRFPRPSRFERVAKPNTLRMLPLVGANRALCNAVSLLFVVPRGGGVEWTRGDILPRSTCGNC